MKRINKISGAAAFILSVCCVSELSAQENLEKIIEKLMASNTSTQIINYNGNNSSLPTYTVKINIYEKPLLDEFIETFTMDQNSANLYITDTRNGKKMTSAIFNKNGTSNMYSYSMKNDSCGFVLYSKYKKMDAAKKNIEKLNLDKLMYDPFMARTDEKRGTTSSSQSRDSILMTIPYRISIPGESIITDGEVSIRSQNISFGNENKVPVKTNKEITIFIRKGDHIYINNQKCTPEEARAKGLNVKTF